MSSQLELISDPRYSLDGYEGTHSAGRGEPLHDWFPYLEGFSSGFVEKITQAFFSDPSTIIEPFNGVGTTPVSLARMGINCLYSEANPFLIELMEAKQLALGLTKRRATLVKKELSKILDEVQSNLDSKPAAEDLHAAYEATFFESVYFPEENYVDILKLKTLEDTISNKVAKRLFRIAVASSLLPSSLLKRAGDVRYRTAKELAEGTPSVRDILAARLLLITTDLADAWCGNGSTQEFITADARCWESYNFQADGVITSPPYLNGTNYIRNTKLELWYLGYLKKKANLRDLRGAVITSAINDVDRNSGKEVCDEAQEVFRRIQSSNYDDRIPRMVAEYFNHMKIVMRGLNENVVAGGPICIDIGDSVYGGEHVPTHDILAAIGEGVGMSLKEQVILRKRTSNRGAPLTQRLLVFRSS